MSDELGELPALFRGEINDPEVVWALEVLADRGITGEIYEALLNLPNPPSTTEES
jgi:hypothetical protein